MEKKDELLSRLKTLYEGSDKDDEGFDSKAAIYLSMAEDIVRNKLYPFRQGAEEIPVRYHRNVINIALFLLYKRGAEGETSHREGDVTRTYENGDVPESMLEDIIPYAGVI